MLRRLSVLQSDICDICVTSVSKIVLLAILSAVRYNTTMYIRECFMREKLPVTTTYLLTTPVVCYVCYTYVEMVQGFGGPGQWICQFTSEFIALQKVPNILRNQKNNATLSQIQLTVICNLILLQWFISHADCDSSIYHLWLENHYIIYITLFQMLSKDAEIHPEWAWGLKKAGGRGTALKCWIVSIREEDAEMSVSIFR